MSNLPSGSVLPVLGTELTVRMNACRRDSPRSCAPGSRRCSSGRSQCPRVVTANGFSVVWKCGRMKDVGTYQAMVVGQLPQFLVAFRHVGGWQSSAGIVIWSFGVGSCWFETVAGMDKVENDCGCWLRILSAFINISCCLLTIYSTYAHHYNNIN